MPIMQTTIPPPEVESQEAGKSLAVQYWREYIRSVMVPLFHATGSYTSAEQESHLQFMDKLVAPNLGPLPTEPHGPYTPPASLVGSPFDPSLNMAASGKAKARFDFDIVGPAQRTGSDPFAEHAARKVALHIASKTGSSTQWLENLFTTLFLSPEETQTVVTQMPADIAAPPLSVGVDFDGSQRVMKCYIHGVRKSVATGRSSTDILLQALRNLEPMGDSLSAGVELLEDYLSTTPNDAVLMLLGIDCLDPTLYPETRVKCYLHTRSNSFSVARDVMTLGGRLDDETSRARIELLRSIWSILRNEPDDVPMDEEWSKPDRIGSTGYSGLQFTIEIAPGHTFPDTKIYVPVFQYAETTQEVERNVELMLQKLGNEWGLTGRYRKTMQTIFGSETDYGQTYVSFAYSKTKGAYTTSYFARPIRQVDTKLAGYFGIRLN
ncbi:aromatic prenyltransferase [Aspergillus steynii IBT 23096]|uniref:Aromatic prenyltransferase n=1 Tax=Aspergillus steynii IBT 23096 TaxID=1392250 RepID=A0A2I2G066_9EURO|nr:aromatic prenyltransferase [Aspergillus steynii IBT 23096]PLB46277.1 aromatic prenyltransferase [Aspergillus steynii IBT 23096]